MRYGTTNEFFRPQGVDDNYGFSSNWPYKHVRPSDVKKAPLPAPCWFVDDADGNTVIACATKAQATAMALPGDTVRYFPGMTEEQYQAETARIREERRFQATPVHKPLVKLRRRK